MKQYRDRQEQLQKEDEGKVMRFEELKIAVFADGADIERSMRREL